MNYDFVVIGAGISGASAACELASLGSVVLLESENVPGYHSTGRSAALYTPHFGSPLVRKISRASYDFLANPKADFCPSKILTPRGLLTVSGPGQETLLDNHLLEAIDPGAIQKQSVEETLARAPLLRPDLVSGAVYEPGVMDIEVATLHQAYLTSFKKRGGTLLCNAHVNRISRSGLIWNIQTKAGEMSGRIIINAAGAWVDEIAKLVGANPVGIIAKRRTAIIVEPPNGINVSTLPAIDFAGTDAYLKPEAGKLMASLGDATPIVPQDAQPEELDIAVLADWLENNTLIKVPRIEHSWAGLRSFVADDAPVVGYDEKVADFFWVAGKGGYGIMMAPALARATASLIDCGKLPEDFATFDIEKYKLSPNRPL